MKNKQFLFGVLFTLLVLLAFGAGKAYAAGCFTDTNAVAACWLKNNGIAVPYSDGSFRPNQYLKRIDAANFLYRLNRVPPRAGDFHFSQALNSIGPNANWPNGSVEYFSDMAMLHSSATGPQYYQAYVTLPTSMYGRAVYLKGVQVCYNATYSGASLTRVELERYYVDSSGDVWIGSDVADTTTRTDKACRGYNLPSVAKLAANNHVVVVLNAYFTSTAGSVGISAITVILSPSLETGTLDQQDYIEDMPVGDPATLSGAGQ